MKVAWRAPVCNCRRYARLGTDSHWCLPETNYPTLMSTSDRMQRRRLEGFYYYPSRHQPFLEKLLATEHEPIG